jgi:hypothetical protein
MEIPAGLRVGHWQVDLEAYGANVRETGGPQILRDLDVAPGPPRGGPGCELATQAVPRVPAAVVLARSRRGQRDPAARPQDAAQPGEDPLPFGD